MADIKPYINVLCLEDSLQDAELLKELLSAEGYLIKMDVVEDEKNYITSLEKTDYDIILADYTLPGYNASEALKLAINLQPDTPFICISGTIGEDKAVELVKQGATDYVLKDRLGRLGFCVQRALDDASNKKELKQVHKELSDQEIIKKQNEELKKLNATKDKFFTIIAHDLRSPFNSILGFSDMLKRHVKHMDKEKIEQMAGVIHQASQAAVDLVANLIEWSLSQSGKIEFNPEYINVAEIVNDLKTIVVPAAHKKNISLNYKIPHYINMWGDRSLLATVLRNLVSNAVKFTHTGGQVVVSATEQPEEIIVSVADSGIGIPNGKMRTLFQIDQSHSTPGTNKEKGTGLGLILCKEFIELHRGRIWVENKGVVPGEGGTTFLFAVPKNPASGV